MTFIKKLCERLFKKRSAGVVKGRLKQIISCDRFAVSPSLIQRIQGALKEILTSELGAGELLVAISSKRSGDGTELTVNASFAGVQTPAA